MDRCTGRRDITEILLNGVKHHAINQSIWLNVYVFTNDSDRI